MLLITAGAALVSGYIRGFAGFGGPAILVLILVQFYTPASILTKVMIIDLLVNIHLLPSTARDVEWKTAIPLTIASVVAIPVGLYALEVVDPEIMKRSIATVTGICVLLMMSGWRFRRRPSISELVAVGLFTGMIFGASYLALVTIAFLLAGPDPVTVSRANIVTWGFAIGLAFTTGQIFLGNISWVEAGRAAVLGLVYLSAGVLGARTFRKVNETQFRRAVLWLLLFLSVVAAIT
jgi:uncharacterized membrane protein YfcA